MSNNTNIHEMAKASVNNIPLHEEYEVTAPSDDVSGASKKGKVLERSDSDNQWEKSGGGEGVNESKKSKRRRLTSTKMLEAFENGSAAIVGLASAREPRKKIDKKDAGDVRFKQWRRVTIDGERKRFIGLKCKVYWPLDENWYYGHISGYNPLTDRHQVKYNDGDEENLVLSNERISFYVSPEEMQQLNLSCVRYLDVDSLDVDDMVALAATLDHCSHADPRPGDMTWAKVTGHPMWPAIVLDESASGNIELLKISGEQSVLVQFFGTHDFARLSKKQVIPFLKGLLSELHRKCKKSDFRRSLIEAKTYLGNEKLPNRMLSLQSRNMSNLESASGEEDGTRNEEIPKNLSLRRCPFEVGGLQIISLGKILKDSELLYDCNYICPEGYTAMRKFPLISDPKKCILYKMEVLRDGNMLNKPLFRVTSERGYQFEGPTSSSCWDKLYRKIRKLHGPDALKAFEEQNKIVRSGPNLFGFSHPEIMELVQLSSTNEQPLDSSKFTVKRCQDLAVGYTPIRFTWKDLDKCNVCHTDEEYDNNPFLQCDSCRMNVHTRCYGELEPADGALWYCNLCRGAAQSPPPCCLCPLTGGAMKPTTDGRWAHLACAICIPETFLLDVKKMEPIDGLSRINKDRWNLLCSICEVSHGVCIQCSNSSCHVAYHPLCARAAGYFLEFDDEDRLRLNSGREDEDNRCICCICLIFYCTRHRRPSDQCIVVQHRIGQSACQQSDYIPLPNPSGCARTEPYNYLGRRGRKEPQSCETVSLKRLYLENRPYLVRGFSHHESLSKVVSSWCATSSNISSMAEKYSHMKKTLRKRLAFGKSGIHGYGIFAKHPHVAGDMPNCYSRIITVNGDEHGRSSHIITDSYQLMNNLLVIVAPRDAGVL